jgi:uncharacterized protein YbjT (DUF2867 family)
MKVIIFGATGMIGQGVLRECVLAGDVSEVLVVGRSPLVKIEGKVRELVHADFTDFTPVTQELSGYDACFFCLGVSSAGMSEAEYTRITYDYTLAAATVIARVSPASTFIYVSGAGTRSDENGSLWARVKGRTENALLALPFKAFMFRPGGIQPRHGATSKTRSYRIAYVVATPFMPLLKAVGAITTTERVGLAMLQVARHGSPDKLIGTKQINALAKS